MVRDALSLDTGVRPELRCDVPGALGQATTAACAVLHVAAARQDNLHRRMTRNEAKELPQAHPLSMAPMPNPHNPSFGVAGAVVR